MAMPNSALKSLLAEILTLDVRNRLSSLEALDRALRAVKGCGILSSEGSICPADPTKAVQLLPSCWAGSDKGDWQPVSAIKHELKVQQPKNDLVEKPIIKKQDVITKPKVQKYEIETDFLVDPKHVNQPKNEKHKVKKYKVETDFYVGPAPLKHQVPYLVEKDIARIGAQREKKHLKTFDAQPLGLIVEDKTGAVDQVNAGQAKAAGVQPGWFIEEVAGRPYDFYLLQVAVVGTLGPTFTVKFREPLITDRPPPEDDDNFHVLTKQGKQANVKMFTIQYPKYTSGIGFLFNDRIVKEGIVQGSWNYLNIQSRLGIPVKVGDQLIAVNNQPWPQIVNDQQFVKDATEGKLGPLTFLYMAEV
jgi:hypothetical protein